jgi:hypothetical protein
VGVVFGLGGGSGGLTLARRASLWIVSRAMCVKTTLGRSSCYVPASAPEAPLAGGAPGDACTEVRQAETCSRKMAAVIEIIR